MAKMELVRLFMFFQHRFDLYDFAMILIGTFIEGNFQIHIVVELEKRSWNRRSKTF